MSLVEAPPALHMQHLAAGDDGVVLAFGNPLLDMSIVQDNDELINKYDIPVNGQMEVAPGQRELFHEVLDKWLFTSHPLLPVKFELTQVMFYVTGTRWNTWPAVVHRIHWEFYSV